jgi:hypothetical protein
MVSKTSIKVKPFSFIILQVKNKSE